MRQTNLRHPKMTRLQSSQIRLRSIPMDKIWPNPPSIILAFTELEQDEMYGMIPDSFIPRYLETAITFGKNAAFHERYNENLPHLMNRLMKSGIRVRFIKRNNTESTEWVRAQYRRKPPTIEIHQSSMDQLRNFFDRSGYSVIEDDLIALHLYHEWFHHLEESTLGHTDQRVPKVQTKRWGPFSLRQRIHRLREIAAHAFTQEAMGLTWSPLLLDHIILFTERGWSKSRIREHFQQLKEKYTALMEHIEDPSP
ncbi:hypothetical protein [Melghirimyces algeriensis]|uniref:Uncharacterized protein n=1 Tax=Melghirimyces algeriensis TaxID=910412 RepID=A0A521ANJ2_9BACL|nr:hypothetical protein [Melghirimyces algeriensis]SMO36365.1 hypothetical protein SAMN06264849_101244 [Melghirimyces algeriensis]